MLSFSFYQDHGSIDKNQTKTSCSNLN